MDNHDHLFLLIERFEKGIATAEELDILENWYRSFEQRELISEKFNAKDFEHLKNSNFQRLLTQIDHLQEVQTKDQNNFPRTIWRKLLVASCFIMMINLGIYLFWKQHNLNEQLSVQAIPAFQAASSKAILTLSTGKQVLLDQTLQEPAVNLAREHANLAENGDLSYANQQSMAENQYHILQTPRAGIYHLTLADGTQAWLNAASSIRYPTSFTGNIREVTVTGEVYFEVAHNPSKPFQVITGQQSIEVLGTHFNVNSYSPDSGIQTTLLEGSVAIQHANHREILNPGEQALFKDQHIQIKAVNLEEVMAWKEGFFDFTEANLEDMMAEFSRWYDLDIQYSAAATKETFTGRIPRSWTFSQVIKIMKTFKSLHISVEGRRVMIRP